MSGKQVIAVWSHNAVASGDFYDWQNASHGYER
jgi:hypothetical protein